MFAQYERTATVINNFVIVKIVLVLVVTDDNWSTGQCKQFVYGWLAVYLGIACEHYNMYTCRRNVYCVNGLNYY